MPVRKDFDQSRWRARHPAITPLLVFACMVSPAGVATAQEQGIYIGASGIATQLAASLDKQVDTRAPDTLVPESRRGQLLHDGDSGDTTAYGTGYLVGYRYLIPNSRLHVDIEIEAALDNDAVEGQLPGVGESAGRNQLGESWPDRWEYDADRNYAVTARLGFATGLFRAGSTSFYVLVGMRRIEGTFSNHFNGCLSAMPCSSGADTPDFVMGSDSRALTLEGTTLGIGVERRLIERLPIRLELRRTEYDDNSWIVPFDDVGVRVPTSVGADQTGLSLSVAWTF